ncbi:MAG: aminotransferase class III-fold pyridoxal phosphate-dependent enzyme [Clostridiales Family XIII bacterium]|jgi:taurine--2-oxoglutarate transaminase|nr:aminotransferase class III-fold pyridoxal phosphate-dependent enzyme [Clostridiales Family XIII bacterium]
MSILNVLEKSKKFNLHSWSAQKNLQPMTVTDAEGIYFYDDKRKKYYDMSSQLVNSNLGHKNKNLIKAIQDQAEKLAFIGPGYSVDVRSDAAEALVNLAGKSFEGGKVFFTNAGAEANENAMKFAKEYGGPARWKFFSMYKAYHGATFATSGLTGEERRFVAEPNINGFIHFDGPYPYRAPKQVKFNSENDITNYYLNHLEDRIKKEGGHTIAAIFIETVVGSNGVLVPPKGYLKGVRELCTKYGILMVCDEVMAGFYRTGTAFAFQNPAIAGIGLAPDIITFAKGSTCGYVALGGVILSKKIASFFDENKMWNGLTYSAHPIGCAATIAALKEYKRLNIPANVRKTGTLLGKKLKALAKKHKSVGDVRYIGLFSQVELVKDKKSKEPFDLAKMPKVLGILKDAGFATYTNENGVMIAPPLIITEKELTEALAIFDKALNKIDKLV